MTVEIRNNNSKKDRQYNDQKKDRHYNNQKKDRQYNNQKKDRHYNDQKKKNRKTNTWWTKYCTKHERSGNANATING